MRSITRRQTVYKMSPFLFSISIVFIILFVNLVYAEDVPSGFPEISDPHSPQTEDIETEFKTCETVISERYEGGFEPLHFEWINMDVDERGFMSLNTVNMNSLPNKVVIPFDQEVYATFLSEDTVDFSNLGWMLYVDAVDVNGFLGRQPKAPVSCQVPVPAAIAKGSQTDNEERNELGHTCLNK